MEFKKAVKTKSRLRLAIDGISGSGKTYTALAIASGMGGAIALIDSEHGSASLYADRFEFDTVDLVEFQIENYTEALNTAAKGKYPVVIVDSTSHAWDALVERVDRIANTMTGGNTSFRAWAQGTPLQKQLIEALLSYPGHVIVTCRSKTEYSVDKDDKGKTTISKVGTAAVQRAGFEYEFTMAMTMDANHVGHVTKDRTSKFQDKFIQKPGKEFGEQLIAWLNEGAEPTAPPKTERQIVIDGIVATLMALNPDMLEFFTNKERLEVKGEIAKTKDIAALKKLAEAWEKELKKRQEEYIAIPFGDAPGTNETAPEKQETSATVPSMYEESEEEDDFQDDIPWGDEEEKPGKRKNNPPSLKEEFQRTVQENAKGKEAESVTDEPAGELDIF